MLRGWTLTQPREQSLLFSRCHTTMPSSPSIPSKVPSTVASSFSTMRGEPFTIVPEASHHVLTFLPGRRVRKRATAAWRDVSPVRSRMQVPAEVLAAAAFPSG